MPLCMPIELSLENLEVYLTLENTPLTRYGYEVYYWDFKGYPLARLRGKISKELD